MSSLSGKGKGKGGKARNPTIRKMAGLELSTGHAKRALRTLNPRVSKLSVIYLTAILEYCAAEMLEVANQRAMESVPPRSTVTEEHLQQAKFSDHEIHQLFQTIILDGGYRKTKKPKKKKKKSMDLTV